LRTAALAISRISASSLAKLDDEKLFISTGPQTLWTT